METTTTAKKPATRKAKPSAAATIAKLHQTLLDLPQPKNSSELQLIDLGLIDCELQVRTEFNDESIKELAANISTHGVLQPILLRPALAGRYTIIAGERRFRAAKLASLAAIPATITDADQRSASAMQLAENIQREELSLKDTAKAIAELGSVQAVADQCHKSKAWVSKRLALSSGLGSYASSLLQDGVTEDIETLKAVSDLEKIARGSNTAWALCEKIRKGQAGRTEARERLAELKEELDPTRKAERERQRQEQEAIEKKICEAKIKADKADAERMHQQRKTDYLENLKADPHKLLEHFELLPSDTIGNQLAELDADTAERVKEHLECLHSAGIGASLNRIMEAFVNNEYTALEFAAFISGLRGEPFAMVEIVQAVQCAAYR